MTTCGFCGKECSRETFVLKMDGKIVRPKKRLCFDCEDVPGFTQRCIIEDNWTEEEDD